MKHKYVYIKWVDASNSSGWKTQAMLDELLEENIVHTIGFIAAENKKSVLVTMSISGDDILGTLTIPTGWILKRKNLAVDIP
jgi:hypothetical protein